MPITITTGLSKKIGLPDYGSLGATCNVSFEVGHDLLESDLEGFQCKVKNAFVACRQAVNDELARHQGQAGGNGTNGSQPRSDSANGTPSNGNGHRASNGNGNGGGQIASEKQMTYARQLAGQIKGMGIRRLEALAQNSNPVKAGSQYPVQYPEFCCESRGTCYSGRCKPSFLKNINSFS